MEATDLLEAYKLRRTNSRITIIEIFAKSNVALSEFDIETQIGNTCDRATIYRTLNTFLQVGLLHKVLDEHNLAKYALCKSSCSPEGGHNHEHVHFKCETCGDTVCLDEIPIAPISLPEGYKAFASNLLITGVCEQCNN